MGLSVQHLRNFQCDSGIPLVPKVKDFTSTFTRDVTSTVCGLGQKLPSPTVVNPYRTYVLQGPRGRGGGGSSYVNKDSKSQLTK